MTEDEWFCDLYKDKFKDKKALTLVRKGYCFDVSFTVNPMMFMIDKIIDSSEHDKSYYFFEKGIFYILFYGFKTKDKCDLSMNKVNQHVEDNFK